MASATPSGYAHFMRHRWTLDASTGRPERVGDLTVALPNRLSEVRVRRGRGPEEIALDGWLEDAGPYVSLVEVLGSEDPAKLRPEPRARTVGRTSRSHPSLLPVAALTFD